MGLISISSVEAGWLGRGAGGMNESPLTEACIKDAGVYKAAEANAAAKALLGH